MEANNKMLDLMTDYFASIEAVKMSERELSRNKTEMENRKNALGKHLVPKDAKVGEKFFIWIGDTVDNEKLLTVEVIEYGAFKISWRN